jgi:hypothetical protein
MERKGLLVGGSNGSKAMEEGKQWDTSLTPATPTVRCPLH